MHAQNDLDNAKLNEHQTISILQNHWLTDSFAYYLFIVFQDRFQAACCGERHEVWSSMKVCVHTILLFAVNVPHYLNM